MAWGVLGTARESREILAYTHAGHTAATLERGNPTLVNFKVLNCVSYPC